MVVLALLLVGYFKPMMRLTPMTSAFESDSSFVLNSTSRSTRTLRGD